MDKLQVKYLSDIFSLSRLLEIIPEHNEIYNHYQDLPVIMHAPVTEGAIEVFMVKSTIPTEVLDIKQILVG